MGIYDDMTVNLPEGTSGKVSIRHFEVKENDITNLMAGLKYGRGTRPGTYTAIYRGADLWMSDTDAEKRDHYGATWAIRERGGRVLIAGLGLGMILKYALSSESVTHVDVVEIDSDVIDLVGPTYYKIAEEQGKTLTIHHADIYTITWPKNTRWDVAWFDIWPNLCTDNLDEMKKLGRSYGRRCGWSGYWGKEILQS